MVKNEYYILNILRGLGALFVIFYHFFVFFFEYQSSSAGLFCMEGVELERPFYLDIVNALPFNIGHLGVAFFFLISGFLILPSLERYGSFKDFLTHKVFRLWPAYIVCFAMGLLFVYGFFALQGWGFPYSLGHVLSYFFWVRDLGHYSYIDGAVWTLEIQIKFYLFSALIWQFGKKNFLEKMCAVTLGLSLLTYVLYNITAGDDLWWSYLVVLARKNLKYYILMLMGTLFYSFYKKTLSLQRSLLLGVLFLGAFLSPLFSSPDLLKTHSYLIGLVVFGYFILFDKKSLQGQRKNNRFLGWVSNISYPLYIGHVLPGYMLMYFMISQGINVFWGIGLALVYSFLMADIVHKQVEKKFLAFFKQGKPAAAKQAPQAAL